MKVTEDTVLAWHFMLENYDLETCLAAFKLAVQSGKASTEKPFGPAELVKLVNEAEGAGTEEAALVWERGPEGTTPRAKEAWRLWGGMNLWGQLPDVKYAPDPARAIATHSFERKRFLEVYESLGREEFSQALQLEGSRAKALTSGVTIHPSLLEKSR